MTKKLSQTDVSHLAKLANLTLSSKESKQYAKQLTAILENVEHLQELDLNAVPESNQVTNKTNEFREDTVTPSFSQKEALSMGKQTHNGYFVVGQLIDKDAH